MKTLKLLLGVFAGILMMSCVKDAADIGPDSNADLNKITSTVVTPEMAMAEVMDVLAVVDNSPTRAGRQRTIAGITSCGGFGATRSEAQQEEEPFVYIVNFADNEGWAIVSGDTRTPQVFVLTDSGTFDPDEVITDGGLIYMLAMSDVTYRLSVGLPVMNEDGTWDEPVGITANGEYIYPCMLQDGQIGRSDLLPVPNVAFAAGDYTTYGAWRNTEKGRDIICQWHQQGAPYDGYCYTSDGKRALAGCVATATAQIMYYWGKNYSVGGHFFDWGIMRKHINTYLSYRYEPAYPMISQLLLELGNSSNLQMSYGTSGSGAKNSRVPITFRNFGYTNGGTLQDYSFTALANSIQAGPVYMAGSDKRKMYQHKFLGINTWKEFLHYDGGHAWVVDRTLTRTRPIYHYKNGVLNTTTTETQNLIYCNWGYGGNYNGYFNANKIEMYNSVLVTRGYSYYEGVDRYYQYGLEIITGIRP